MSTRDVYFAIEEIVDKWYLLGINLSIPPPMLDTINCNSHKIEEKKTEMIQVWMTGRSMPTWSSLVEALQSPSTDQPRIAERISHEYSKAAILVSCLPNMTSHKDSSWLIKLHALFIEYSTS